MARRHDPFDKRSALLSIGTHLALLLVAWASTLVTTPELDFVTFEIEMVSPPTTIQAEEEAPATEEMTVERPDPTPPEPELPEPEPEEQVTVEQDDPPEDPPEPDPDPVTEVSDEPTEATTTEEVTEEPVESGEDMNVRMEGLRRDFPAYYGNIVRQIQNCFRAPREGSWATTIFFYIERDGSVSDMEFVTRSGNFDFDFSAMGAVECAGGGRFGPLPDDLPWERLPIQFTFERNNDPTGLVPVVGRPSVGTNE